MTPTEFGLTVAVVVLAALLTSDIITAYAARECLRAIIERQMERIAALEGQEPDSITADAMDCISDHARGIDRLTGQLANHKGELSKFIELANGSEQKRDLRIDELQAALQELASKHLPVHASHDLLTVLERQIAEVRETVAGMLVSRVALKASPFEEVNYRGLVDKFGSRPEAFADAAHAACPDPRWKSDCEPAVVIDEDDQVTTLGEPVFVTVDERVAT